MTRPEKPVGILNPAMARFRLIRKPPSEALAFFVERYWILRWDLAVRESFEQETLPHPCVNVVFERGGTRAWGVSTRRLVKRLEGKGHVFGIKFRPGAFQPWLLARGEARDASSWTNGSISFEEAFGVAPPAHAVLDAPDDDEAVRRVEAFLLPRRPPQDANVATIHEAIDAIVGDPDVTKVDRIVERIGASKRTLQRLFRAYVGVSPKWVIQRYRLQEAIDRVAAGHVADWAKLALDLGYFDQAHFTRDFKAIVGVPPSRYARASARDPG